jgi:alanine racemase
VSLPAARHPAWAEIDLDALESNARVLRALVAPAAELAILVKANGYGHGTVASARAALAGGADQLVVAAYEEAVELREAGIGAPVLVAYPVSPDVVEEAAQLGIAVSVSGLASAGQLLEAWRASGNDRSATLRVQVEVDSGMARGGAMPDQVVDVFETLERGPHVAIAGLWSHLSNGSSPETTQHQVTEFEHATERLRATGRPMPPRHMTATEGLFVGSGPVYDMVRIGLAFYGELGLGVEPSAANAAAATLLRPAMTIKARAVHLEPVQTDGSVGYGSEWTAGRRSTVATLPIGYADGWARSYWPGGQALVQGRRVPIVGRISMDSTCVDVTDVPGVGLDDEFVLLGRQGDDRITANELAGIRKSIPNEVLATLGPRIPRRYVGLAATR